MACITSAAIADTIVKASCVVLQATDLADLRELLRVLGVDARLNEAPVATQINFYTTSTESRNMGDCDGDLTSRRVWWAKCTGICYR